MTALIHAAHAVAGRAIGTRSLAARRRAWLAAAVSRLMAGAGSGQPLPDMVASLTACDKPIVDADRDKAERMPVTLEGVEKRQHTFQQLWLDSPAGRCPDWRRGNRPDGGWQNRLAGEQNVEWEVADGVGRSGAEQMRDIAADVPLAVARDGPVETDPVSRPSTGDGSHLVGS